MANAYTRKETDMDWVQIYCLMWLMFRFALLVVLEDPSVDGYGWGLVGTLPLIGRIFNLW